MKNIFTLALFLVLVGAGCGSAAEAPVKPEAVASPVLSADWINYEDPSGLYSFAHPKEIFVSLSSDKKTITLLPSSPEDSPVPDMTIRIEDGHVEFKTWENFEIPYFKELVSTFRFKK